MKVLISAAEARRFDRRRHLGTVATAIIAAAVVAAGLVARDATVPAAVLTVVPIPLAAWAGTVYAFTEVDSSGIRTRRWLPIHRVSWQKVAAVKIETTRSDRRQTRENRKVLIEAPAFRRFHLGAPNEFGVLDADFRPEFDRIRADWSATRRGTPKLEPYRLVRSPTKRLPLLLSAGAAVASVLLAVLAVQMRPEWAAHREQGTFGTYTVTAARCGKTCSYTGEFGTPSGTGDRVDVGLAGGGRLEVGDQVAAIDVGARSVYPASGGGGWIAVSVIQAVLGALGAYAIAKLAGDFLRHRRELLPTVP